MPRKSSPRKRNKTSRSNNRTANHPPKSSQGVKPPSTRTALRPFEETRGRFRATIERTGRKMKRKSEKTLLVLNVLMSSGDKWIRVCDHIWLNFTKSFKKFGPSIKKGHDICFDARIAIRPDRPHVHFDWKFYYPTKISFPSDTLPRQETPPTAAPPPSTSQRRPTDTLTNRCVKATRPPTEMRSRVYEREERYSSDDPRDYDCRGYDSRSEDSRYNDYHDCRDFDSTSSNSGSYSDVD